MEWKEVLLSEFLEFNPKRTIKKNEVARKITMDLLIPHSKQIYSFKYEPYTGGAKFTNGDTIMARITPCLENGKHAYVSCLNEGEIAYGSTEYIVLCGKNGVSDNEFVYYLSHTPQFVNTAIKSMVGSSGRQRAQVPVLENLIMPVPVNLSDQRKIAGILSALDSKIENNNKINGNLEAQAQALFKSWFVDFTPFKDQPFVDSELGPIPQGWKVGKLGDYCEVKSGYAFKSSWWTNKGYKIIKIKNISENGDINLNDCSCVLPENCDKAKNFIANTGDIVIAMTGATIGKFNIIPKIDEKFYINQRVGKFFLGEKPIEKVPYIYCFLKQENISTQIIQKGQGSAQPNISGADIESIPMLTPMSIILKYNKMCQPLFEKILSNRLESKKLSALRDTLLPKLMSGEIKL